MKYEQLYFVNQLLIALVLACVIIIYAQEFFIPFTFSIFGTILLFPLSNRLEKKGMPRHYATLICIGIALFCIALVVTICSMQLINLAHDLPTLQESFFNKLDQLHNFVEKTTNIPVDTQLSYLKSKSAHIMSFVESFVANTITTSTSLIVTAILIIFYIHFLLDYREKWQRFIVYVTPHKNRHYVSAIIAKIPSVTAHYLMGLLLTILIFSFINSIGLALIGIKYSLFLGILAAFLYIIPYIGVFIGAAIAIFIALLTHETLWPAFFVALFFFLVQILENEVVTPYVVGTQVKINPLAFVVFIIIGDVIWGIPGMVLFTPLLGIIKIICDTIENLKPYGYLMGTEKTINKDLH